MKDSAYQDLLDTSLRRPLTAEEAAAVRGHLQAHPEARDAWEEDQLLTEGLRRLPEVSVSSNFTSRVVHAVERAAARDRRRRRSARWRAVFTFGRAWQAAFALLALGVGVTVVYQHRLDVRSEVARNVAAVSTFATLPSLELLQDFDSINTLPPPPLRDADELLAALK
jgi:anti-sigma factor RsiW